MKSFNADSLQGSWCNRIGQAVAQASNQQGAHVSSRSKDKLKRFRQPCESVRGNGIALI